jgi:thiamine-phosphate pyrophosphorylase
MHPLIVISHTAPFPGEAAIICQLFERGLNYFHLRKPAADEVAIRQLLDALPAAYHTRIALHNHHQLADEYGIRRLHFTEQHRTDTDLPALTLLSAKGYLLTTSVHSVQALQLLPPLFSYAFLGPVFNSISKPGYQGIGDSGLYLYDHQKPVKVIALGGIQADNMEVAKAMNFDGVAVLGALWHDPSYALKTFEELQWKQQDLTY